MTALSSNDVLLLLIIASFLFTLLFLSVLLVILEKGRRIESSVRELQRKDFQKANSIIEDAQKSAQEIILNAQKEAENIMAKANTGSTELLEKTKQTYESEIQSIGENADKILNKISTDEMNEYQNIISKAHQKADEMLKNHQQAIDEEREKSYQSIHEEVETLKSHLVSQMQMNLESVITKYIGDTLALHLKLDDQKDYLYAEFEKLKQEI